MVLFISHVLTVNMSDTIKTIFPSLCNVSLSYSPLNLCALIFLQVFEMLLKRFHLHLHIPYVQDVSHISDVPF